MQEINSSQNDTYKNLKQLASSSKHRRRNNQTLIEGIHLCQSYLDAGNAPIACVYSQSAMDDDEVREIVLACGRLGVDGILMGDNLFRALSALKNTVGILFVVAIPESQVAKSIDDNSLLLDDLQDPGNVGTILRTAAAAGVDSVYLSSGSVSVWSPKVLRAGMGAHFALNIYDNSHLSNLMVNSKVQVLATSLEATETIYQSNLAQPTAWLFGNEGQGVSAELLALSSRAVIIPQSEGVESINVAATVAICLFEQKRQRFLD